MNLDISDAQFLCLRLSTIMNLRDGGDNEGIKFGTFISDQHVEIKGQVPFQLSDGTFVFGALDPFDNLFKMVNVDQAGYKKECRHTSPSNVRCISQLDNSIWDAANQGGRYRVSDIVTEACGDVHSAL